MSENNNLEFVTELPGGTRTQTESTKKWDDVSRQLVLNLGQWAKLEGDDLKHDSHRRQVVRAALLRRCKSTFRDVEPQVSIRQGSLFARMVAKS
jgi:hypothetical protein